MSLPPAPRSRRLASLTGPFVLSLLAGCLSIRPPGVAPGATLAPGGEGGSGPRSRGPFAVVFAGPKDEVADPREPGVTVLFNRPMRTLDRGQDEGLAPFELKSRQGARVSGALRWVGTRGMLFSPDAPLPAASEYDASVAAGARALDGAALGSDYAFSFSTPRPALVSSYPAHGARTMRPNEGFTLVFNQAVAPAEIEARARIAVVRRDGEAGEARSFKASRRRTPIDDKTPLEHVVDVVPDSPLPLDSGVVLTLPEGLRGAEGPLPMKSAVRIEARTYGPLLMADFFCPRIDQHGRCRARSDISVTMTNPVSWAELRSHLKAPELLVTKPDSQKKKNARPEPDGPRHFIGADPRLGKSYKVTLTAGMKDIFGQALARDVAFEIAVEAPFRKASGAAQPGPGKGSGDDAPVAAAALHPPDDGRARRAQLRYELDVGLVGRVLEAQANLGVKSHRVPVGSINVPTYGLTTGALSEPQVLAWFGGAGSREFAGRNGLVPLWISPGAAENTRSVHPVDLDALLASSGGRGAALLMLEAPGEEAPPPSLVTVTDLGVTAKLGRHGSLFFITRLSTGKPVKGARVSIRVPGKGEVAQADTDDDGLVQFLGEQWDPLAEDPKTHQRLPTAVAFVKAGEDWTFHRLERSIIDQQVASPFQDLSDRGAWVGTLYTERGVYRPGEKMKVAGIFRKLAAAGLSAASGKEAKLTVRDGNGAEVFTARAAMDAFGAFSVDVPLPKGAHLGDARVTAEVRDRKGAGEASSGFQLAAYKASEFRVEVEAQRPEAVRGGEASFVVKADYLYGAPMAGASMHTTLTRTDAGFKPPGAEGLVTTDATSWADETDQKPRETDLGASDAKLDAEGRSGAARRLDMPGQKGPERVVFEVEVEDVTRQTVAARGSVLVHPAAFYLAMKPPKDRFVQAGSLLSPEIVALDPSGAKKAGVPVHLELIARTWTGATEEQGEATAHRSSRFKDALVASCDVATQVALRGCELRVPDVGYYLVRATARDGAGNQVRVSTAIYGVGDAGRAPGAAVGWPQTDARSLKLEANAAQYDVGDAARFMIRSPFREAEALITVERDGVLYRQVVAVSGPMPVVTIPIKPEFYPNAFVSVHLVRGRVQTPPEKGADLGGPEYRLGYAELKVNPDAHRIKVGITPSKRELRPGEELDVDVETADRSGKPVNSELVFYAVDEGVLMLTGYETPDPLPAFTARRSLAVYNAENREGLAHILPMKAGERVAILGLEYEPGGADKGGRGGSGDIGGGGALRKDFRATAFFEAGRVTGPEGRARYHVKMPDNLTSFRLMAVAASTGDYFGSGEARVTTSQRLMARPSLPRFLRAGDRFEASVALSSKGLGAAEVDVGFAVSGAIASGATSQRVKVPAAGSVEVRFPVTAASPGEAAFEFHVKGGSEEDRVRVSRHVDLPLVTATVSAYGETREAAAVALGDLRGMRPDEGGLEIRMASSALVGLGTSLERLVEYPYGCTEQLTSHTLPLLSLSDLSRDYGARLPENVPHAIEEAVDKIAKNQREDGGFGFWEDSRESEPWLSAYATLTLDAAHKRGVYVAPGVLDSAVTYLKGTLTGLKLDPGDEAPEPEPSRDDDDARGQAAGSAAATVEKATLGYENAAFVADALADLGAPDAAQMNRLYDARKGKPLPARALLLHAMATATMARPQLETLAKELAGELRVGPSEAVADEGRGSPARMLDSPARTTALALRALLAVDPAHPLAPRLARGLLGMRQSGAWASTQENAWALLALRDYRKAQEPAGGPFKARAFVGQQLLTEASFTGGADHEERASLPAARLLDRGGQPLAFQVVGEGRVYYAAELRYQTAALPSAPADEGFFVQKILRSLGPEELTEALGYIPRTSVTEAQAGKLVLVDLLLESSEPRQQVVIDDPLPAGLEPVDYGLETTSQARPIGDEHGARKKTGAARPDEMVGLGAAFLRAQVHRELKDDRVLTFIEAIEPGMYHFRYVARATSVGHFVVPPTRVEAMYAPDVHGRTAAGFFDVRARP